MLFGFTIDPHEKVLWTGRPEYKPFVASAFRDLLNTIGFFVFTWSLFLLLSLMPEATLNWPAMFLIAFFLIGGGLCKFFSKVLTYKRTAYLITDRHVYIQSGIFKPVITRIEKKRIIFININTSKAEKKHIAGTIVLDTGEEKIVEDRKEKVLYELESLKEPGSVLRFLS